jgi:predicted dehydrogenase
MAELQVAIIGCGAAGSIHVARWAQVSGARIAAICDTNAEVAFRVATEFGAEAHTEWEELLTGGGLDIVDICVPPNLHAPIALRAFEQGMHVLCEKPLALNPEAARAMVQKAAACGKLLMTAFCHRFHPPILFAKEMLDNDDLGRIIMFRSRFSRGRGGAEERWGADQEIAGGGVLMGTGVHSIDLFRYLVGEVASVTGKVASFLEREPVEDSGIIVLQAKNGALGVIEASWATPGGRNVLELYGTAGACIVDYDSNQVHYKTADMVVWETREVGGPDRFQREICHFADAVRGLQTLEVTGYDGLRANEIVAEVYEANR